MDREEREEIRSRFVGAIIRWHQQNGLRVRPLSDVYEGFAGEWPFPAACARLLAGCLLLEGAEIDRAVEAEVLGTVGGHAHISPAGGPEIAGWGGAYGHAVTDGVLIRGVTTGGHSYRLDLAARTVRFDGTGRFARECAQWARANRWRVI